MKVIPVRTSFGSMAYRAYVIGKSKHYSCTSTCSADMAVAALAHKYWNLPKEQARRLHTPSDYDFLQEYTGDPDELAAMRTRGATHVIILAQ